MSNDRSHAFLHLTWCAVRPLVAVLALISGLLFFISSERPSLADGTVPGASTALSPAVHENTPSADFHLHLASQTDGTVQVEWHGGPGNPKVEYVFRSTHPLAGTHLDAVRYPITRETVTGSRWTDAHAADHVAYSYQIGAQMNDGRWIYSDVASVEREDRPLTPMAAPTFWVDKHWYVLEVRDGERIVKRYPIALGHNPLRRKLHQDNASTPEGVYRIVGVQPHATYFKAYDINYPNSYDQLRYHVAREAGRLPSDNPSIGGEIQIHGKGIDTNWTWGCMALRNDDMVELFSHNEIAAGVTVHIVGNELCATDLVDLDRTTSDRVRAVQTNLAHLGFYSGTADGQLGETTMRALGKFQLSRNLPLTCQPDARTLSALGVK